MSEEKKYKWIASITVCIFFFANISKKEKKEQVVNLMLIRFMLSSTLR